MRRAALTLAMLCASTALVAPAFSQTPPAAGQGQQPPAASQPATTPTTPGTTAGTTTTGTSAGGQYANATKPVPGHMRADDLIGTRVYGQDNANIGTVDDLIVDPKSGRVEAAVLSVGGFLGIGDKLVSVPMNELQVADDGRITIMRNREQLTQAPEFEYEEDNQAAQRPANGAGAGGTGPGPVTSPGTTTGPGMGSTGAGSPGAGATTPTR
ncbi:MAG TPA: PRC-barrel domain-containing protein [Azospirillaceae bacterium]|nr:PRC-barrel domain-containing protein [Azospirillaceae bacterium]